jgi:hypothetical protein
MRVFSSLTKSGGRNIAIALFLLPHIHPVDIISDEHTDTQTFVEVGGIQFSE